MIRSVCRVVLPGAKRCLPERRSGGMTFRRCDILVGGAGMRKNPPHRCLNCCGRADDGSRPDSVSKDAQVTGRSNRESGFRRHDAPAYGIEFPSMLMSKLQATMAVTGSVELRLTG